MDWTTSSSLKRKNHKKRAHFGKSTSEPNLSGHFTPRFPDNLSHLIHEYVTVDELKFYRKRRPPNVDDEFHRQDSLCLYDKNQPIIPFAHLKTEYTREFGKDHSSRSRSVPNKFDLNATTKELLDALRDDFTELTPERPRRATTAKISGEIEIESGDELLKGKPTNAQTESGKKDLESAPGDKVIAPSQGHRRSFKVQGELTYTPEFNVEFKGTSTMERSESIPQMNNIKFFGQFRGTPEYRESFKTYNHIAKSAPIKAKDHLRVSPVTVNTAIISPTVSSLSEYTDKFKEIDLFTADRRKLSKHITNVAMRNNLMIGHSDQHVFPEYFESFKDPHIKHFPEKARPRSPILGMNGDMDYNPEYRVKFTEFPRRRPVTQRPESHFDFFDPTRKSSPVRHAIVTPKFKANIAIVQPTQNIHKPPTIDKDPFYLCQPEVRKARHEILIKKRSPTPSQTISAAVRSVGRATIPNEDEENLRYNERARIVSSPVKPPVQVFVDSYDEPTKPILQTKSPNKSGRRVSMQTPHASASANPHAKRNLSKIIEGNYEYSKKKSSLTSSTDDEFGNGGKKLVNSQSLDGPSFVVLKDSMKQNKWMKSTSASAWYL